MFLLEKGLSKNRKVKYNVSSAQYRVRHTRVVYVRTKVECRRCVGNPWPHDRRPVADERPTGGVTVDIVKTHWVDEMARR